VGKRVLVTGAARGMGRSHAIRLAEEGADLILIDLCESLPGLAYPLASREDLEETAELVRSQGRLAVTKVADVRDEDAMRAAVAEGAAELGGLDAAVANAGVSTAGTWAATTAAQWRLVLDVKPRRCLEHLRRRASPPGRARRKPGQHQLRGRD
jgi:NAD(P)-dependent dehydrogenase (short-subunit alcohol dehydrogenase family)